MIRFKERVGVSKVRKVVEYYETEIKNNRLKPKQRIMSIRAASQYFGVSKNTIVEAYDRLMASGYLKSKPSSGFFVSLSLKKSTSAKERLHVTRAIDTASLLKEQLNPTLAVRVGDGRPPASWMSQFDFDMKINAPVDSKYGYNPPMGFYPLREILSQYLYERGIQATPNQIVTTYGANHAMDMIIKHFLVPGDVVFVDSPGYYPLFSKLKLYKIKIIGIDRLTDGSNINQLEEKAKHYGPKLFFTQSLGHNPTGGSISLSVQYQILKLAEKYDFLCIDDDAFADLFPGQTPRMAAIDQLDRVIYIGTYSKTLSANLRVGYIAGKEKLIKSLSHIKMLTLVSSSDYLERWLYEVLTSGQYLRHIRRLGAMLDTTIEEVLGLFEKMNLQVSHRPERSYYLWVELEEGENDMKLAQLAAEQDIFLAPGSLFYPEKKISNLPAIRVNLAYARDSKFIQFMLERAK